MIWVAGSRILRLCCPILGLCWSILGLSLSRCDNHYGVVRSQKGEGKNRGIRFAKMDYAAAFAVLKPDSPAPSLVVPNFLFKVAPTPLGTTHEQIQVWITVQGWDAKPIRALSSTVWLCGAETKFEDIFVQWNDSPVLIRWITQKKGKEPIILAGQLQKETATKATKGQEVDHVGGGLKEDPWKSWIENKGGSGLPHAGNYNKTSTPAVVTQPPRRLEAPIEDRFNQHQTAIQELREKNDKDTEALRSDIAKLEKTITAQQQQVQLNMEMTNAEFRAVRTETQNHLQTLSTTFQDSLQKALQQHDHQMYNQFNELKQLMMGQEPKLSPPQKKPRGGKSNDNEDDDAKL